MRATAKQPTTWALLLAAGCSQTAPPPPTDYDSVRARQTLITALDYWRQGKANQLSRENPPIRFADDDLVAGWRLIQYTLPETSAPIVGFQSVAVNLVLRDASGRTLHKSAAYQIGLAPNLSVLRSDP